MAPKCLPSELLFESALFIHVEDGVPNVLTACWVLQNFVLPRVLKRKEKKIINKSNVMFPLDFALKKGFLDPFSGVFRYRNRDPISLRDALTHGFVQLSPSQPMVALSLTECIEQQLIDAESGIFEEHIDSEDDSFALADVIGLQRPYIHPHVRECYNTATKKRLTVAEAVIAGVLNLETNKFILKDTNAELTFRQAHESALLQKPRSIVEIMAQGMPDDGGHFNDRGERITLLQAINAGFLDVDVRQVKPGDGKQLISIREALRCGRMTSECTIKLRPAEYVAGQERKIDFHEALRRGLLTRRDRHTIFDVKGFSNPEARDAPLLSYKEGDKKGRMEAVTFKKMGDHEQQTIALRDMTPQNCLSELLTTLFLYSGKYGEKMSLLTAYDKELIRTSTGRLMDSEIKNEFTISEAYSRGMIDSLRNALRIAAVLDIHPELILSFHFAIPF